MVVERNGGPARQQEHPHAEHLRLADVHVADRGALQPRRRRRARVAPGSDFKVRRSDGGHQRDQFAVFVHIVVPVGRWFKVFKSNVSFLGDFLDESRFVVPRHPGCGGTLAACPCPRIRRKRYFTADFTADPPATSDFSKVRVKRQQNWELNKIHGSFVEYQPAMRDSL